jgi:hypothetical protein
MGSPYSEEELIDGIVDLDILLTCVNCALIPTYLLIAFIILLYVDNIHEIFMLQVESNR